MKAGTEHDVRPLHRYPRGANQLGVNAMPTVTLLCPVCDFLVEGPDDFIITDDTFLTCTNPLNKHAFTHKDAMDQMAKHIETTRTTGLEGI
jgi:hypothetical protein